MKKLIGLSLSRCCEDMANGLVDPASVKKIIAATSFWNEKQIEELIEWYSDVCWPPEIQEMAAQLFRQFLAEGKVEQPRNTQGRCPDVDRLRTHWVTNKKEIRWRYQVAAPKE